MVHWYGETVHHLYLEGVCLAQAFPTRYFNLLQATYLGLRILTSVDLSTQPGVFPILEVMHPTNIYGIAGNFTFLNR